ncbi:hypothetical protein [Methylocella tundrae]|uniref:Uncharacterized protein n=1 Tax=Methylocella tundrae TaxID=227605 RepID=A0A4U8YW77_METTU|nr:hypothetical protein [Methylocella tundrae]WPP05184.1 hypothetical protein SIN04_04980 [Methylocella tundrae]VFU07517.1 conserved protein of unknown function [Methylocella tundrae]
MSEKETTAARPLVDDELFMSVADLKAYVAEVESAKASQSYVAMQAADQAKKDLIERLSRPIDLTPEKISAFMRRVKLAAERGEREMLIGRFPSELCTDHGRAINNTEEGWPETLIGLPLQVHQIWKDKLQPLGYGLKAMIIEWPEGFPGDVGMFLTWK